MQITGGHITYISSVPMSAQDREILIGFIDQRNTINPTSIRTKGKQAYIGAWIVRTLTSNKSSLEKCSVNDLLKVASKASSGEYTKNSRQTMISPLQALAKYINRFHHQIDNLDLLTADVKAGSAAKNRKEAITVEQWHRIINLPMCARDRAILAVMYDGYHRPFEVLLIRWSDLKQDAKTGEISYEITFKTEKPRIIVQKRSAPEILELWRRECGANLIDDTPIFPARNGEPFDTIGVLGNIINRIKIQARIKSLKPSVLRTSAITHDVDSGQPVSYICLRAWGEPYNDLINLYTKPNSGKIQRDQHGKTGVAAHTPVMETSGNFFSQPESIDTPGKIEAMQKQMMEMMGQINAERQAHEVGERKRQKEKDEMIATIAKMTGRPIVEVEAEHHIIVLEEGTEPSEPVVVHPPPKPQRKSFSKPDHSR